MVANDRRDGDGVSEAEKSPDIIRTLNFWGAAMRAPNGSGNWVGDCPLCGKERHFFCDVDKTVWDCKVCGASGNHISFLTAICKMNSDRATKKQWTELSQHRHLPISVLKEAGLGYDGFHWLVPCASPRGVIHDVRRYDPETKMMMSTAGCKVQLWMGDKLAEAPEGTRVWLCEGEWDAIAMMWLLKEMEVDDDVVVAVPGAAVFKSHWADLFRNKQVITCYDADNAGDMGTDRAIRNLAGVARAVKHVSWPVGRPTGWDIRDHIVDGMKSAGPSMTFKSIMGLLSDKPRHHDEDKRTTDEEDPREIDANGEPLEPATFQEVVETFKKHVVMTDDLELALMCSLAVISSNEIPGDPVWMYLVGPPGAGKTMLLSALSETKRAVFRSSVTPHCLISGWRGDAGSAKDPSLIPRLKGKTLVAKDFTEILSMPVVAQEEVFSTLRGAYDGYVQKTFGNGITREYLDCHFSLLAGVTSAIHGNRQALLGERFLKLQISKLEGAQADSIIESAIRMVGIEKKMETETKLMVSRFLIRRLDPDTLPDLPPIYAQRLTALVQLVAAMRAQVEREKYRDDVVVYRPIAENGTRLAKQLMKLGLSIAHVLDKKSVDAEVYGIIERVAMDTAHGFNIDIIEAMMKLGGTAERGAIVEAMKVNSATIYRKFDDLTLFGILTPRKKSSKVGRPVVEYIINQRIQDLWMRAKSGDQSWKTEKKRESKPTTEMESPNEEGSNRPSLNFRKKLVLRRQQG
jgi:hypothetical protein